jgi:hypothetical protein
MEIASAGQRHFPSSESTAIAVVIPDGQRSQQRICVFSHPTKGREANDRLSKDKPNLILMKKLSLTLIALLWVFSAYGDDHHNNSHGYYHGGYG